MKTLFLITLAFMLWTIPSIGQEINPKYDSTLAKRFGADEYGMKSYILVILKTGENDIQDETVRDSLFAGHFDNINQLADKGKLIVAGPLAKNDKEYRGIFILDVTTIEEAEKLLQHDPTVKENVLDAELYKWYGPAALPEYLETQKKVEKFQIK